MRKLMLACALGLFASPALAGLHQFGPTPYLQFSDSPFAAEDFSAGYFHLESFEDSLLNTPGLSALGGFVLGPGLETDSVDGDDGLIDGFGKAGHSYYANDSSIEFDFDAGILGHYPTHVGVVWTDVGETFGDAFGIGNVVVEAFDGDGFSLGVIAARLGDGQIDGTTAEDRFFGYVNPGGVAALVVTMPASQDWEVDHVQYGYLPEPASLTLLGLTALFLRRRR